MILENNQYKTIIANIEETKRKRKEAKDRDLEVAEKGRLIQLPMWPDPVRGVPNPTLRSSLFAAMHPRYSKYLEKVTVLDNDKLKIIYTGQQLTQFDFDVWKYSMHLGRQQNLGYRIYTSEYKFLKGIDRHTGSTQHAQLNNSFTRLIACCAHVIDKETGNEYKGSFVHDWDKEKSTERIYLEINPKLARLFEMGHTYIQWDERKSIGGNKPLALWLHGYMSTNVKWYPHKIKTIMELSGSTTKALKHFRKNLIDALDVLKSKNLIESYRIDENDLLHIYRKLSQSQQKYLENNLNK